MYNPQKDVETFMTACGQEVPDEPRIPHEKILYMRSKFLTDETLEFVEAAGFEVFTPSGEKIDRATLVIKKSDTLVADMPEMAKELADINYVAYGAANALGIDLPAVFTEVQRSNMTKVGLDGKVTKNEYGKVMKPSTYQEADVKKVLAKIGWE